MVRYVTERESWPVGEEILTKYKIGVKHEQIIVHIM